MGGKKAVEGHKLANAQISKLFFTISYKITQIELGSILKKKEVSIRKYNVKQKKTATFLNSVEKFILNLLCFESGAETELDNTVKMQH